MKTLRPGITAALICAVLLANAGMPSAAYAETNKNLSREQLMGLAKQFMNRVGSKFQQMETQAPAEDPFDRYMDGEVLLFDIYISKNIKLSRQVTAIKQDRDVMVLLEDFITAADFPIQVNATEKHAEGWFIRENNPFTLDIANHAVRAGDKSFVIADSDILIEQDDLYVRSQALANWFGFELKVNPGIQSLDIKPEQRWPVEEKLKREFDKNTPRGFIKPPSLPLQEEPYDMVSVPNIDLQTRTGYKRNGEGESTFSSGYTSEIAGDIAGHTGSVRVTGNKDNKISDINMNFYKESSEADLLGPLNARRYEFGDIGPVNSSLIGGGGTEVGARVSNKDQYVTYDTLAQITGDAAPGWDVELYRGDLYIGTVTVDDDGRYTFNDVPLFVKENNFRIVQYGPQGEVREETKTYNVDSKFYENNKNLYDVSISMANSKIYSEMPSEDIDKDTPHLAATYERQITPNLAARTGVQLRQEEGEQKAYAQAGIVGTLDNTIINADTAIDDAGAYGAALTARQRLGTQSLSARAEYRGEDFNPGNNTPRAAEYVVGANLNGALPFMGIRPTYNLDSEYRASDDGSDGTTNSLALAANVGRLTFGNTISHVTSTGTDSEGDGAEETSRTTDIFSLRGSALGMLWRATTEYEIQPDSGVKNYTLDLSKRLDRDLRGRLKFEHEVTEDPYSSATLSLDWEAKQALISPSIAYDSNSTLTAALNVKTALARDPYSGKTVIAGETLSDKGGISAHVFLDKNGDNIFNDGEDLLQDVRIKALHANKTADTDEKGEAFIYNLPDNRVTDVFIEEDSFTDPYWIAGTQGVSIRPRAGHVSRIEFPVHLSGELDGSVIIKKPDGSEHFASNTHIHLYDQDGKIQQTTVTDQDGFYWMTKIPPGTYSLVIDGADARAQKIQAPLPQSLSFGFEGTIKYGNNIYVQPDNSPATIDLIANLDKLKASTPALDVAKLQGSRVVLNLGSYNSNILMGLTWYKLRTFQSAALNGAEPLVKPSESYPSPKTGLHTLRVLVPGDDLEKAYDRCRLIAAGGQPCTVEVLPPPESQVIGMR